MIRHFWFLSGFPIEENKNYVAGSIIFLAIIQRKWMRCIFVE